MEEPWGDYEDLLLTWGRARRHLCYWLRWALRLALPPHLDAQRQLSNKIESNGSV